MVNSPAERQYYQDFRAKWDAYKEIQGRALALSRENRTLKRGMYRWWKAAHNSKALSTPLQKTRP